MDKVEMLEENELNEVVGGNNLHNLDLYRMAGITPGDKKWQFYIDFSIPGIYEDKNIPEPKNYFYYGDKEISDDEATELVYYYFENGYTKAKDIQSAALFARSNMADFKSFINKMNVR